MPLQKQYVEIPLGLGGVSSGVDEKVVESPKMLQLKNVQIDKSGAINLRNGYKTHSITGVVIDDVVPIALAKRGLAKVVVCDDTVAEYSTTAAGWAGEDDLPPTVACESFILRASRNYDYLVSDCVVCNGLVFIGYYTDEPYEGVIVYDPASHTVINDSSMGGIPRLAVLDDYVLSFVNTGSFAYVRRIDSTDIDTGWTAAPGTMLTGAATGTLIDVDYDSTYAYAVWTSSTPNYYVINAVDKNLSITWNNSGVSGTGAYDIISVTKHPALSTLLVMTANSASVDSNIVDSTDGSQDQTGTVAITDARNITGYAVSTSYFRFIVERPGSTPTENYVKKYPVTISNGNIGASAGTTYGVGLGHKAVGYTTTGPIIYGLTHADDYESFIFTVNDLDGVGDEPMPLARFARSTMAGESPVNWISQLYTDDNDVSWFAFNGVHRVVNEDGSITTSKAIALARYDEDDNKRLNYVEAQNLAVFSGGWPKYWDGQYMTTLGFPHAPTIISLTSKSSTGLLDNSGVYQYIAIYEYVDSHGQITRSAPSVAESVTLGASDDTVDVKVSNVSDRIYHSDYAMVTTGIYRTENGGTVFYRTNPQKTGVTTPTDYSQGHYIYTDETADSALIDNELLYTEGGVLGNDPPPPFEHCCVHKNRLFVVSTETGDLHHSKEFLRGEGIAFNDEFLIPTGHQQNRPIGLVSVDEGLVLFWRDQISVVYGDGPNDLGAGGSFTLPRMISQIGVTADERRSIVKTPVGVFFKSDDGFKLLDRGMQVQDIGRDVTDFNSFPVIGADLQEDKHLVKFTCNPTDGTATVLVYNYLLNQWFEHDVVLPDELYAEPCDSIIWDNQHTILMDAGTSRIGYQDSTIYYDFDSDYEKLSYIAETNWIKLTGLQGYQRVWRFWILGEYKGKHDLQVDVDFDYHENSTETFDIDGIISSTYVPYQIKLGPANQRCEAIKFTFTLSCTSGQTANALANLTSIRLEYGADRRPYRLKNTYT